MGRFRGAISIYCFMAEHNGDKSVLKTYGWRELPLGKTKAHENDRVADSDNNTTYF
jgi:hypothetical protein